MFIEVEGYTHGVSAVIRSVTELQHDGGDTSSIGLDGKGLQGYGCGERRYRQGRPIEDVSGNLGWAAA
ncbi:MULTISPECIES: hypothetical protein, partial [Paraburkholderia]